MNAEELFEEVGFTHEYRSEFEDFFRPYFDTESDLIDFFCTVFKNDKTDKRPRWMMNDIQRFVALADDIDKIRPGRDPLRILFFRVCLEALQKDSGAKKKGFFEKFESYFSVAGKQYILSNFSFTGIGVPEELEGFDRALFNTHENYQLTVMDFLCIIKATRNAVVHDGDYWSMQFFARDNEKQNILSALDGKPAREYKRYSELRKVINEAIENHIDMLVLPEAYVPFEWLPSLSRVCANNQLALITGVEHVVSGAGDDNSKAGFVYNLTAVILPYKQDDYNFAYVSFHNKVYYSPKELSLIHGYHHKEITGNTYHLYCWRDVWFSVYCCYELTSIHDRAVFQNYADLIIAVEWNSDVPYFGTVVESLVRDLHCYCIQANSSDYGDSRLLQPTQTEIRDAIKTKGGKNPCVLFDEIDIKALRDFQAKSVDLQKKDGPFKQTPPGLNRSILAKKRSGTLKEDIEK